MVTGSSATRIALPAIQPTGKDEGQQLKGFHVEHGGSLDQATRVVFVVGRVVGHGL